MQPARTTPLRRRPHRLRRAQRPETRANLVRELLRLFPGRKVSAFGETVVMNQFGIRFLRPALRGCVDLIWKHADGNRDGDVLRRKEVQLVFPIQSSRRDCRVRQPIERDVVEDVGSRKALGLTVKTRAMSA
jgi:hypothetical protein